MKLITAIIQPDKLDAVREALYSAEITRITVSRVTGHGRQEDYEIYRGQQIAPDLMPKIRIDIACNDGFVDVTCNAIIGAARSTDGGRLGDGKVFVTHLEECIRIRTGEKGGTAI